MRCRIRPDGFESCAVAEKDMVRCSLWEYFALSAYLMLMPHCISFSLLHHLLETNFNNYLLPLVIAELSRFIKLQKYKMTQKRINQQKCNKLKIKLLFKRFKTTTLLSHPVGLSSPHLTCPWAVFYRVGHSALGWPHRLYRISTVSIYNTSLGFEISSLIIFFL